MSDRMKIVFTGNDIGELFSFRGEIINMLSSSNDVFVVAPVLGNSYGKEVVPILLDRFSTNPLKDLRLFFQLLAIYRKIKPDYIFHYTIKPNIYGTFAAKILGIPSTAVVVGLGQAFYHKNLGASIARFMLRTSLRLSSNIITINKTIYNDIALWKGIKPEKVILSMAGEGIDVSRFPLANKEFEEVCFMVMAKLQQDKGAVEFKKAAELVHESYPNVHFLWLGGCENDNPNAVHPDLFTGSPVDYHDAVKDVKPFLSEQNTVFVLPSYHEGLSRALMEACSVGCPCIVSDIAGCRELVDDGVNGFLAQKKNAQSLADAMIRFVGLPHEQKKKMSLESRRIVTERASISEVLTLYNSIINPK